MIVVFYIAAVVGLLATLRVITCAHAVHALLYFIVSLFAVAVIFFALGAPFVAALEVIIYAGAIMVLFVFLVMLLGHEPATVQEERAALRRTGVWIGPVVLALILVGELIYVVWRQHAPSPTAVVGPREVGLLLFGPYLLGVEIASFLLLAGLIGAYHVGRRDEPAEEHRA
jgi:NADH-quinone oxidoreductase subunit J